jgi:DNA-binding transcriptional ArsR family regulator
LLIHHVEGRIVSIKLFGSFVRYKPNKLNFGSNTRLPGPPGVIPMASPLPLRPPIDHTPRHESAVVLGEDDSTDVLEALASDTARAILSALTKGPATASDVADEAGTSLQNAHYHLTNLRAADLVTEAGTWYSEKGREMPVYAVTSERLELRFSPPSDSPSRDGRQHSEPDSRPRHAPLLSD